MLITEKRLEAALRYIAKTDEEIGKAKGFLEGLSKQEKIIVGEEFLSHTGTKDERMSHVHSSQAYKDWKTEFENATTNYHILKAKRDNAFVVVEVWRSLNASMRKGNV